MPNVKISMIRAQFSPLSIARIVWKRKISILFIWVLVSAAGVYQVKRLPSVYSAEALILVDSQKIPEKYVPSTVSTDLQDRFERITQQLLSRSRLTKIIQDFDLYHAERQSLYPEQILDLMRKDITIAPVKGWAGQQPGAFRVAYQGRNPVVVAEVANRIAQLYVEENLKTREVQAEGTSEFIDAQLKEAKKQLDQMEAAVSAFKARYNGELPQQEASLNSALARLQVQLETNRDATNRAEDSKFVLENSLAMAQDNLASLERTLRAAAAARGSAAGTALSAGGAVRVPERSEVLQAQLDALLLRYSEAHPEVKRVRVDLAAALQAERQRAASAQPAPAGRPAAPKSASEPAPLPATPELTLARERVATLRSQLALASQEIENRKAEQRRIVRDIEMYQGRIARIPLREQEMARITRDYEISRTNYRSLVDKKMAAEMAREMERRQKSERFSIGDPARVPEVPISPNRRLYAAGISLFGLVLGLAFAGAYELRKDVLLGEWELPGHVAVLGSVPRIAVAAAGPDSGIAGGRRRWMLLSGAALSGLTAAAALYFGFYRS